MNKLTPKNAVIYLVGYSLFAVVVLLVAINDVRNGKTSIVAVLFGVIVIYLIIRPLADYCYALFKHKDGDKEPDPPTMSDA